IVVGVIHIIAMVVLLVLAYRARASGSVPDPSSGPVPEEAEQVFSQFLKEEDSLDHAFRPNRRMFMVSRNLPHFFVLTALATFFSVYTYKWLGDNTVWVYTSVHATAIVILFAHSAVAWKHTWYGVSPRAIYTSFGSFSPLVISMPLKELDSIEVVKSRLKGMLDVSSLKLVFDPGKGGSKVDMKMRAIDSPDRIKEVIWDEAERSKKVTD
ncbi:MAG: PH domain-containing protein, partial [Thermoplasmata archaeon]